MTKTFLETFFYTLIEEMEKNLQAIFTCFSSFTIQHASDSNLKFSEFCTYSSRLEETFSELSFLSASYLTQVVLLLLLSLL